VNTGNQAADIFTKSLASPLLEKFKRRLGLISSKELSFLLYYGVDNCETVFQDFVRTLKLEYFAFEIATSHF